MPPSGGRPGCRGAAIIRGGDEMKVLGSGAHGGGTGIAREHQAPGVKLRVGHATSSRPEPPDQ
jgi:hypothetical protein